MKWIGRENVIMFSSWLVGLWHRKWLILHYLYDIDLAEVICDFNKKGKINVCKDWKNKEKIDTLQWFDIVMLTLIFWEKQSKDSTVGYLNFVKLRQ